MAKSRRCIAWKWAQVARHSHSRLAGHTCRTCHRATVGSRLLSAVCCLPLATYAGLWPANPATWYSFCFSFRYCCPSCCLLRCCCPVVISLLTKRAKSMQKKKGKMKKGNTNSRTDKVDKDNALRSRLHINLNSCFVSPHAHAFFQLQLRRIFRRFISISTSI